MRLLIKAGLMPADEGGRKRLELLDPYELRARAVTEALSPHEVGRAVFHLGRRRGFKSGRMEQQDSHSTARREAAARHRRLRDDQGRR